MTSTFATSPFVLAALLFGLLGIVLVTTGLMALIRLRPLRFALRTLIGLLLLSLGALSGGIGVGMRGYRALTREDVAARVLVRPLGSQRFEATFRVPDRPEMTFELAGDQIYLDAHILKWTPMANVLPNRLLGHGDTLLGQQILRIAEAERKAVVGEPDGVTDDLGRGIDSPQ